MRKEIFKYKSTRWASFLSTIQFKHDNKEKTFWSHLSGIYKAQTLPFSKLSVGTRIIADEQEIVDELFTSFKDQSYASVIDSTKPHDAQMETEYTSLKQLLEGLVLNAERENVEKGNVEEEKVDMMENTEIHDIASKRPIAGKSQKEKINRENVSRNLIAIVLNDKINFQVNSHRKEKWTWMAISDFNFVVLRVTIQSHVIAALHWFHCYRISIWESQIFVEMHLFD